jgi:hypothetical protein
LKIQLFKKSLAVLKKNIFFAASIYMLLNLLLKSNTRKKKSNKQQKGDYLRFLITDLNYFYWQNAP